MEEMKDTGGLWEKADDIALIRAFLGGAEAAFEALYRRHKGQLYGFLIHLTGSEAEASEVFSETWIRALDKLPRYRDDGKFGAWLLRIGRNYYWDRCRRRNRYPTDSLDAELPPAVAAPRCEEPEERRAADETGRAIEAALRELPPEQREVFLLRQQEISFREIATMQRVSVNTVLSRMQYALRSLRKKLAGTVGK
ncbi:MAG: sigma-70 family RNA polymerase sigma factor [Victivallaceae bacterium]|nr:sigma-70 family RNA polymerase sigma factor [Victivallaceae bacterium]